MQRITTNGVPIQYDSYRNFLGQNQYANRSREVVRVQTNQSYPPPPINLEYRRSDFTFAQPNYQIHSYIPQSFPPRNIAPQSNNIYYQRPYQSNNNFPNKLTDSWVDLSSNPHNNSSPFKGTKYKRNQTIDNQGSSKKNNRPKINLSITKHNLFSSLDEPINNLFKGLGCSCPHNEVVASKMYEIQWEVGNPKQG